MCLFYWLFQCIRLFSVIGLVCHGPKSECFAKPWKQYISYINNVFHAQCVWNLAPQEKRPNSGLVHASRGQRLNKPQRCQASTLILSLVCIYGYKRWSQISVYIAKVMTEKKWIFIDLSYVCTKLYINIYILYFALGAVVLRFLAPGKSVMWIIKKIFSSF